MPANPLADRSEKAVSKIVRARHWGWSVGRDHGEALTAGLPVTWPSQSEALHPPVSSGCPIVLPTIPQGEPFSRTQCGPESNVLLRNQDGVRG